MKLLKLWRTFKEGFSSFYRNGWLSVATITVLTLSLYMIGIVLMLNAFTNAFVSQSQDNINISAYFNPGIEEERIFEIKEELEKYREIKSVEYVSKEDALEEFLELEGDNSLIKETLEEIGENPLLPSLIIKANEIEQYEIIDQAISNSTFRDDISKINYQDNKTVIDDISTRMGLIKRLAAALGIIFILLSILITFNTIRITIFSRKQEFEVMRLVGASNIYVQMPFVFEGIFYGIVSSVLALLLLLGTSVYVSLAEEMNLSEFGVNFGIIFLVLIMSGIVLGVISGLIAIRRYLKK